jgi:hypothetical protein
MSRDGSINPNIEFFILNFFKHFQWLYPSSLFKIEKDFVKFMEKATEKQTELRQADIDYFCSHFETEISQIPSEFYICASENHPYIVKIGENLANGTKIMFTYNISRPDWV